MIKKILYVDTWSEIGGGQVGLLDILKSLDRTKFSPTVVIPDANGPLRSALQKIPDVEIIPLTFDYLTPLIGHKPFLPLYTPFSVSRLARLFVKKNIDLVHANHLYAGRYTCVAARSVNIPNIMTMRNVEYDKPFNRHRFVDKRLVDHCDAIIFNSKCGCDIFKNRTHADTVSYIHNGIFLTKFLNQNQRQTTPSYFGIPDHKRIFITIANLSRVKGHHILIDAIPRIIKAFPDTHFVFVGSAYAKSDIKTHLKTQAQMREVADAITWIDFCDTIPALFALSFGSILPSISSEGLPRSIIESMASGVPPISTAIAGIPELIEHEISGFLCPPNDPHSLADACIRLCSLKSQQYIRMQEYNRLRAQQQFDITVMMKHYEELYTRLTTHASQ
ncbi:MAG: glycosyltransferase family 4 protein [Chitinivibrionales bacterium]|nr:glycosyltransferase family 4 protein [Chitinivibrionales bacterium]